MNQRQKIEIFSAGCSLCRETIDLIHKTAAPSCEIIVHDMQKEEVIRRAKSLGIQTVPAVVIDGVLAS